MSAAGTVPRDTRRDGTRVRCGRRSPDSALDRALGILARIPAHRRTGPLTPVVAGAPVGFDPRWVAGRRMSDGPGETLVRILAGEQHPGSLPERFWGPGAAHGEPGVALWRWLAAATVGGDRGRSVDRGEYDLWVRQLVGGEPVGLPWSGWYRWLIRDPGLVGRWVAAAGDRGRPEQGIARVVAALADPDGHARRMVDDGTLVWADTGEPVFGRFRVPGLWGLDTHREVLGAWLRFLTVTGVDPSCDPALVEVALAAHLRDPGVWGPVRIRVIWHRGRERFPERVGGDDRLVSAALFAGATDPRRDPPGELVVPAVVRDRWMDRWRTHPQAAVRAMAATLVPLVVR